MVTYKMHYRWIGIYGGTTADHHCSMRSERNHQGTSVLGQVGPYCAWFPSIRFPADFKGPLELENLKKSPDGQVPIWGSKHGNNSGALKLAIHVKSLLSDLLELL